MNKFRLLPFLILLAARSSAAVATPEKLSLGNNAALRYWSAFAEMQDAAITDAQARQLNLILGGTVPYDDLKYRDLVEKNRVALATMARASTLRQCDWGVEYQLGPEAPVEYVRKALTLGRLNVLYAFHLLQIGDQAEGVRAVAAGLRFSRDVATGGTLFAAISAKDILDTHLGAIAFAIQTSGLTPQHRSELLTVLTQLGPDGIDWQAAMKRELSITSEKLARLAPVYAGVLDNPARLPELQRLMASEPPALQNIIPNPKRVLDARKDLADRLTQTRALLQ